jgi:ABC-2 type transport system ATP-binding protein
MLTTMLPPTSGGGRIAGFDIVREAKEVRGRIGYVPQLLSADGALTAYENLLLSARLYLIPRREREARIDAALREMELDEAKDRLVQTFSGGMIRRLEIAQSMLHNPAVLFMDEPTVGLDPVARHSVWDRVRSLRERFGTTMLLTTHLMDEADVLCDRIGVLHAGVLEAVGTPAELKARVGPQATLDDVFAAIAGGQIADEGSFRSVRAERRAERAHG